MFASGLGWLMFGLALLLVLVCVLTVACCFDLLTCWLTLFVFDCFL